MCNKSRLDCRRSGLRHPDVYKCLFHSSTPSTTFAGRLEQDAKMTRFSRQRRSGLSEAPIGAFPADDQAVFDPTRLIGRRGSDPPGPARATKPPNTQAASSIADRAWPYPPNLVRFAPRTSSFDPHSQSGTRMPCDTLCKPGTGVQCLTHEHRWHTTKGIVGCPRRVLSSPKWRATSVACTCLIADKMYTQEVRFDGNSRRKRYFEAVIGPAPNRRLSAWYSHRR